MEHGSDSEEDENSIHTDDEEQNEHLISEDGEESSGSDEFEANNIPKMSTATVTEIARQAGAIISEDVAVELRDATMKNLRNLLLMALQFSQHEHTSTLRGTDFEKAEETLLASTNRNVTYVHSTKSNAENEDVEIDLMKTLTDEKFNCIPFEAQNPKFNVHYPKYFDSHSPSDDDAEDQNEENTPCDNFFVTDDDYNLECNNSAEENIEDEDIEYLDETSFMDAGANLLDRSNDTCDVQQKCKNNISDQFNGNVGEIHPRTDKESRVTTISNASVAHVPSSSTNNRRNVMDIDGAFTEEADMETDENIQKRVPDTLNHENCKLQQKTDKVWKSCEALPTESSSESNYYEDKGTRCENSHFNMKSVMYANEHPHISFHYEDSPEDNFYSVRTNSTGKFEETSNTLKNSLALEPNDVIQMLSSDDEGDSILEVDSVCNGIDKIRYEQLESDTSESDWIGIGSEEEIESAEAEFVSKQHGKYVELEPTRDCEPEDVCTCPRETIDPNDSEFPQTFGVDGGSASTYRAENTCEEIGMETPQKDKLMPTNLESAAKNEAFYSYPTNPTEKYSVSNNKCEDVDSVSVCSEFEEELVYENCTIEDPNEDSPEDFIIDNPEIEEEIVFDSENFRTGTGAATSEDKIYENLIEEIVYCNAAEEDICKEEKEITYENVSEEVMYEFNRVSDENSDEVRMYGNVKELITHTHPDGVIEINNDEESIYKNPTEHVYFGIPDDFTRRKYPFEYDISNEGIITNVADEIYENDKNVIPITKELIVCESASKQDKGVKFVDESTNSGGQAVVYKDPKEEIIRIANAESKTLSFDDLSQKFRTEVLAGETKIISKKVSEGAVSEKVMFHSNNIPIPAEKNDNTKPSTEKINIIEYVESDAEIRCDFSGATHGENVEYEYNDDEVQYEKSVKPLNDSLDNLATDEIYQSDSEGSQSIDSDVGFELSEAEIVLDGSDVEVELDKSDLEIILDDGMMDGKNRIGNSKRKRYRHRMSKRRDVPDESSDDADESINSACEPECKRKQEKPDSDIEVVSKSLQNEIESKKTVGKIQFENSDENIEFGADKSDEFERSEEDESDSDHFFPESLCSESEADNYSGSGKENDKHTSKISCDELTSDFQPWNVSDEEIEWKSDVEEIFLTNSSQEPRKAQSMSKNSNDKLESERATEENKVKTSKGSGGTQSNVLENDEACESECLEPINLRMHEKGNPLSQTGVTDNKIENFAFFTEEIDSENVIVHELQNYKEIDSENEEDLADYEQVEAVFVDEDYLDDYKEVDFKVEHQQPDECYQDVVIESQSGTSLAEERNKMYSIVEEIDSLNLHHTDLTNFEEVDPDDVIEITTAESGNFNDIRAIEADGYELLDSALVHEKKLDYYEEIDAQDLRTHEVISQTQIYSESFNEDDLKNYVEIDPHLVRDYNEDDYDELETSVFEEKFKNSGNNMGNGIHEEDTIPTYCFSSDSEGSADIESEEPYDEEKPNCSPTNRIRGKANTHCRSFYKKHFTRSREISCDTIAPECSDDSDKMLLCANSCLHKPNDYKISHDIIRYEDLDEPKEYNIIYESVKINLDNSSIAEDHMATSPLIVDGTEMKAGGSVVNTSDQKKVESKLGTKTGGIRSGKESRPQNKVKDKDVVYIFELQNVNDSIEFSESDTLESSTVGVTIDNASGTVTLHTPKAEDILDYEDPDTVYIKENENAVTISRYVLPEPKLENWDARTFFQTSAGGGDVAAMAEKSKVGDPESQMDIDMLGRTVLVEDEFGVLVGEAVVIESKEDGSDKKIFLIETTTVTNVLKEIENMDTEEGANSMTAENVDATVSKAAESNGGIVTNEIAVEKTVNVKIDDSSNGKTMPVSTDPKKMRTPMQKYKQSLAEVFVGSDLPETFNVDSNSIHIYQSPQSMDGIQVSSKNETGLNYSNEEFTVEERDNDSTDRRVTLAENDVVPSLAILKELKDYPDLQLLRITNECFEPDENDYESVCDDPKIEDDVTSPGKIHYNSSYFLDQFPLLPVEWRDYMKMFLFTFFRANKTENENEEFDEFSVILKDLSKQGVFPVLDIICDFFLDYIGLQSESLERGTSLPESTKENLNKITAVINALVDCPLYVNNEQLKLISSVLISLLTLPIQCNSQQRLIKVFLKVILKYDELLDWAKNYIKGTFDFTVNIPLENLNESWKSLLGSAIALLNGLESVQIQVAREHYEAMQIFCENYHALYSTLGKPTFISENDTFIEQEIFIFFEDLLNSEFSNICMSSLKSNISTFYGERLLPHFSEPSLSLSSASAKVASLKKEQPQHGCPACFKSSGHYVYKQKVAASAVKRREKADNLYVSPLNAIL